MMEEMQNGKEDIPVGKYAEANVLGPLKTADLYIKGKIALRKYEKAKGVTPLKKFKSVRYSMKDGKIQGPLMKILSKGSPSTTDVFKDEKGNKICTCSYTVEQKLINKNTSLMINLISTEAREHNAYYYLSCEHKYNVVTNQTQHYIDELKQD